jgi:peptidoglycan hydrolase-like protein with peptidoglycan-binding domain/lysophospholipase L1-like esterase
MRFYEIKKLIEAEGKPGYYVIGDSHAEGVAKGAGKPWVNTGVGGHQADSGSVRAKVSQITPGSVVVVAAGANDTANSFKAANKDPKKVIAPNIIAGRVKSLVDLVKQQKPSKVILLVFPNGKARTDGMSQWYNGDYQEQVRSAIKSAVDVDQIIDQNDYQISSDNIHLSWGEYVKIGKEIVANNPIKGADSGSISNDKTAEAVDGLKSGPPYPPEETYMNAVKDLQRKLEKIGYSVGETGIDGKYGPRTIRAVTAFKKDYELSGTGLAISTKELETLAGVGTKIAKVKNPTPTDNQPRTSGMDPEEVAKLTSEEGIKETIKIASNFLGRPISPDEFVMLARVTRAEATSNPQEIAQVAAVILNRVRSPRYPDDVFAVVNQPGQFQVVTGRRIGPGGSWSGPEGSFAQGGLAPDALARISKAFTDHLPSANKEWLNFTAADKKAYGVGTNIGFRDKMLAQGGKIIGGTVFGTVT